MSAEPQPNLGGTYQFPTSFVGGPTLFGQDAAIRVGRFEIRSKVARGDEYASDSGQQLRSCTE
jgi:hypothetical protein